MKYQIRLETAKDHRTVEHLTREAFWDVYHPGCSEHLILHRMREVPAFVPELDFVAVMGEEIVGHIAYTKGAVVSPTGERTEALIFGPLSVRPDQQGRGVGSLLVRHSLKRAAGLGYKGVFIFGNPGYYGRFGFQNAERFGVTTREGENFDAFMGLELFPGGLKGVAGKFYEDPVFTVSEEDVAAFDRGFPFKEKHVTDTQLPG